MKNTGPENKKNVYRRAAGQVLTEYVIMLVILLLIAMCVFGFSYFFNIYGERMTDTVSVEYP